MAKTKICRYCGEEVSSAAKKCNFCGKNLYPRPEDHEGEDFHCTNCQTPVYADDNYCPNCGMKFTSVEGGFKFGVHSVIPVISLILGIAGFAFGIYCQSIPMAIALGLGFAGAFYLYFFPTQIAIESNNPNTFFIFLINFLLGETVIGWLVALGMALYFRYNPEE